MIPIRNLCFFYQKHLLLFKTRKKNNITPENINIIMLEQIPDISFKTANAIINKYKTIA